MQANYGSSGNVFGYNFVNNDMISDANSEQGASVHGNSAQFNLWEGNFMWPQAMFDCIHGSSVSLGSDLSNPTVQIRPVWLQGRPPAAHSAEPAPRCQTIPEPRPSAETAGAVRESSRPGFHTDDINQAFRLLWASLILQGFDVDSERVNTRCGALNFVSTPASYGSEV
jgi:hypothetical protein